MNYAMRAFALAALLTLSTTSVFAQAVPGNADLQFDAVEAGWVDQDAGLVWGFDVSTLNPNILNWDWVSAVSLSQDYPIALGNAAQNAEADGDYYQALADAETDPAWAAYYQSRADALYAEADATFDAAIDAVQHTGWRLATLDEVQLAWAKGLFTFGRNTLLTAEPPPYLHVSRWTSTTRHGGNSAFRFYPNTGDSQLVRIETIGSLPIVVRSLNPDDDGDGGGNGNGNGNGKGKNK